MMLVFRTFVLVASVLAQSNLLADRECPCTLNNLWVDVVVLIDTSTFMGMNKLIQVISDVGSVFIQSEISPEDGQFSKVGIITYDSSASVRFNMTYFDSTDKFEKEIWDIIPEDITDPQSNLYNGLQAASSLLSTTAMENRPQVILIYAATYQIKVNDPAEISNKLKANGVFINVVSFTDDQQYNENLERIASPGMFMRTTNNDLIKAIQQNLCQSNCYCPFKWVQFTDSTANPPQKYGECLFFGVADTTWTNAQVQCEVLRSNGYLASVFNNKKMSYLMNMARSQSSTFNIFVGISNHDGSWQWEQGQKNSQIVADEETPWAPGYPKDNGLLCGEVYPNDALDRSFGIRNVMCALSQQYVCESRTCDTDNYCQ